MANVVLVSAKSYETFLSSFTIICMLSVSSIYPDKVTWHPPLVLIHGAANSAKVWTYWQRELATHGWISHAIDLRGHGESGRLDLAYTSMQDYADDVHSVLKQLSQPPVVIGWSMGGLIAMMVASPESAIACVVLAPSAPAKQLDTSFTLRTGEFGPEEYGIKDSNPEDQPSMPDLDLEERIIALASLGNESRLARDERKAGIVIESLSCPLLIVTGTLDTAWPRERYDEVRLDAEFHTAEGASHWGLVLNRRALSTVVPVVSRWLASKM